MLVPPRILRRVIKRRRHVLVLRGQAGRQTAYSLPGPELATIFPPSDLGLERPGDVWPETVYLLERRDPSDAAALSAEALLTETWRRLFRLRVREIVRGRFRGGGVALGELSERIERIGRTEFEEARTVFRQDGWLVETDDQADAYALFAAHFLELARFAPGLLRPTFPAIEHPAAVEAVLASDVDAAEVLAATRLPGAPESPALEFEAMPEHEHLTTAAESRDEEPGPSEALEDHRGRDRRLALRAREVGERGNVVRSALLWTRVAEQATNLRGGGRADRAEARAAMRRLAKRLREALGFPEREEGVWTEVLAPLLPRAARGFWSPEARFLYDLQRVCLDHERPVFRLDLVGWALTLGRRPLKHPLPHLREVSVARRLRRASGRLRQFRLERDARATLESLIRPACTRAESALRDRLRPKVRAVLDQTWVAAVDLPERVAVEKLVEELLDQVVDKGRMTLGDLRDGASRSDLKFPDLGGPREFWEGGRLLETDRRLAEELDGVHQRGEVYLRWLQRFSMLAFGTRLGRWFTRFVVLPFGGSFVALEGVQHLVGAAIHVVTGVEVEFNSPVALVIDGLVVMGLINAPGFRSAMLATLASLGRTIRAACVDWPARVLDSPLVRRLLRSRPVEAAWRFLVRPGLLAGLAWAVARLNGVGGRSAGGLAVATLVGANLLFNTRTGQAVEDAFLEVAARWWRSLWADVVPGLFRLIMSTFEEIVTSIERVFYAVDEGLRFRGGAGRLALVFKAVLGPIWLVVVYLARIYINVLIEPQVNPIKHFPVVTVSHKVILPMTVTLTQLLETPLAPFLGRPLAAGVAWSTVFLLPGMFGFLVWELKSNWRLYEANRPASLGAVVVGGHGETVTRLLRPGFHSGTLPKAFLRLRRACRRAWVGADRRAGEKAMLRQREALHHVEESVRRFVERDVLALLAGSRFLGGARVALGEVRMATNRLRIELLWTRDADTEGPPLVLDLEERDGVLVGGVAASGWLGRLDDEERRTLDDALTGLMKKSGVELVQTPGAELPPASEPVPSNGRPFTRPLKLGAIAVSWPSWAERWRSDASASSTARPLVGAVGVLPERDPAANRGEPARSTP